MARKPVEVDSVRDLYDCHSGSVFAFLISLCGERGIAEELTQEAFFRAMVGLDGFQGRASVRTWLMRIARNVYLSRLRRQERMWSLEALEERGVQFSGTPDDPEAGVLARERGESIQRAILRLSERDRSILFLSIQEGMTCREIASVLGLSVAAVKVRRHRARR